MKISKFTLYLLGIYSATISSNEVYTVKPGDVLSEILWSKYELIGIYGRNGFINETIKLNPFLNKKNGNFLRPGMQIIIPISNSNKSENIAKIPHSNSRRPTAEEVERPEVIILPDELSKKLEEVKVDKKAIKIDVPVEEKDNFIQSFYYTLEPFLSWKKLSSVDDNEYRTSSIFALSDTCYGMSGKYGMHFSKNFDFFFGAELEKVKFSSKSSISLGTKSIVSTSFSLGVNYKHFWSFKTLMSDQLFLTNPNTTVVEIENFKIPGFEVDYKNDFYKYKEASIGYDLKTMAFVPYQTTNFNTKFSYGIGGGVEVGLKNQFFRIGYEYIKLKSKSNSTDVQNIVWTYQFIK
jgi:hypothetical protein